MKPCKYADGVDGEWECTVYNKIGCPFQDVEYNYIDYITGHKEINVIHCTMPTVEGGAE